MFSRQWCRECTALGSSLFHEGTLFTKLLRLQAALSQLQEITSVTISEDNISFCDNYSLLVYSVFPLIFFFFEITCDKPNNLKDIGDSNF